MKHWLQKPWFRYVTLFIGVLCISWSAIFVKIAEVSGFSSAFYRMFIGFIGILPIWFIRRKAISDWESVRIAILCGIFFAIDIALWNTSILLTKAAISTLLANLAPVWVGIGAIFILKDKPPRIFWGGTLLAIAGVLLIVGTEKFLHASFSLGHFLALIASMFYGAYILTTRKGRSSLGTIPFTAISMGSSVVVLLILAVSTATPLTGFPLHSWVALIGLGLISQLGGWLAINYSLGYIPPTIASVSLLSQSVFTALLSVPVLSEFLSWIEIVGAMIVLTGIYLVNRKVKAAQGAELD